MAASSPSESLDDSADLVPAGPRMYPSDELLNFQNKLSILRSGHYPVQALLHCLEAAWLIVAPDTEKRQTDMDAVRRFLREDLYSAVEKILNTGTNARFWIEEDLALDVLHQLMKLAAAVLKYRQQQSPAVLQELDADICSMVLLLMHAFNPGKHLHQRFRLTSIPQQVYEKNREEFEAVANAPFVWVVPQHNIPHEDLQDDDMQQDDEVNAWLTHIANVFGTLDGFSILVQMLRRPADVSYNLMNTSAAVLAQACEHASEEAKQQICLVLDPVIEHMLQLVASNDERLADYGSDRTYNIFRCLVNINLPRMIQYCVPAEEKAERYAKVNSITRAFVDKMLDSSSFNKLLSGARECHKMLQKASENDEDLWAWMQQNHIVERLLRTGLHHKQYMVEVTGVMAKLTETSELTAEHLDLMWAVTEKEDAYDAVKTNMYDLLADVALNCQPTQLDMLFAKLERSQARSAQDTERLLTLLEKLALSDAQNNMRSKIVQLVLELTTMADAPPELLEKHSLGSIMKHYLLAATDRRDQQYCYKLITTCFTQLKDGSRGQVPLLRTARGLLDLLPPDGKNMITRSSVADELENKHKVVTNLVHSLCSRISELQQKITAATAAAAGGGDNGAAAGVDAAAIKAAALAEMQEGSWGHAAIVKEYLTMLRTLAANSTSYFPEELPAQLWDALMVSPPDGEDHMPATQLFFKGGFNDYPGSIAYFEGPTQRQLLESHLGKQDVVTMSIQAAGLTWEIFTTVNGNMGGVLFDQSAKVKDREAVIQDLDKVIGLDLLWRIYLHCKDDNVASNYSEHMLHLYHSYEDICEETPSFRRALVKQIVHHMREAADKLGVPDQQEAALAARTVARCLGLATAAVTYVEEEVMPPVPEHRCAWRGTPMVLEVQREGVSRLRLSTHDNEYIGLLRERLAHLMGCSAKHVRMLNMGKELQSDHETVQSSGLRNRACLIVAERSKAYEFTKSPSEYRPTYELFSYTWMFAQADGLYPLLLQFADTAAAAAAGTQDIASMALELLAELPTHAGLSERLGAALDGPDKHQQLASLLDVSSSSMAVDYGSDKQCAPYQTLYALQTLCALLFPTFDEALLASADREAVAEGSACPSPAAAAPGLPQHPPGAAEAPANAAEAAAVSAVQHQHHREVQQQEFLQSGGLEVVLDAAHKAAASSSSDLRLRRQLSELLVLLLHNLLDAASSWQAVPWTAAAGLVLSNGPSAMSGAESGAGQPAGAARHAPPTGSHPGATSSPVESASMPLAADALPTGGALLPVLSSGAADDSSADRAALSSKAPATTSETACHHPASPAMEVSSPLPGQQQQQSSKQRQRGGDLPPLPSQQQQTAATANGNAAGAGTGPSLAALFSEHTLKLMADTLLGVAVDTGQLWGSGTVAAATPDDDTSKDVAVAREALQLLQRLLEQHPPLVQPLLLNVERPALVSSVLLSPYYSGLRRQAGELLERLVSIDTNRQRLLPWLLSRLAAARSLAQQRPASCAEFYQLLSTMLTKLGHSWGMLPEQLFATANTMLDEEVAALQAMAASGPSQGPLSPNTKQQQLRRRRRRQQQQQQQMAIDGADAGTDGEGEQPEPPSCSLLQGRLQLVLALVRVLDRRAVGSEGQGGLMKLLLQQFLFPEAVVKAAAAAGPVDLQHSAASLEPHCATPSSRKAALELLAELMGDTASSLEEGVNMLLDLHYQQQVLGRFNMLPRLLRPPGQYAGVRNGGATCYMNAVFQQLFMQPSIRARILGSAEVPDPDQEDSVFAQLQGLFAQLALSKATFASPQAFWAAFKDYDGTPIDVREHQDAYEFFTRLQDCVDQHLISTNQEPAIKPVMGGTFVQQIICRGVNYTSERNEDFYQISVEVKGMGTLQRSLDDYVKGELMEGDNAYLCEHLGKRVSAVKRTGIRTLPQMLCVHLKRFEFDYHNQTRHKLRDRFEFPQELDMFPYTAEGLAAADALQKAAEEQQQQQQDGQPPPRPVRSSSGAGAAAAAAAAAQAAQGLHPDYMYDLHGIVVHSGSAFTGHYYSYIKERPGSCSGEQGPRWYCFDDKDVQVWDEGNLERDCYGGKASQDVGTAVRPTRNEYERAHSAYMLFYERRQGPGAGVAGSGGSAAALGAAVGAAEQQQQDTAAAAADTDVEMAAGDASQPSPASAAAAAAAAAVSAIPSALVATTPPRYQQQHGYSNGTMHYSSSGSGFAIPYGMPEGLFRRVTEDNVNLIWQRHVLDKHYFRFVRQLVDSRGDLGQLTTRKSRRREAAGSAGPGPAGAQGALFTAAVPSGSSDRAHSSMACDPPGPHQQQQQSMSTGSGALGIQASPSGHMAAAAAHAAGGARVTPLDLPGSSNLHQQQNPGVNAAAEAAAAAAALSPGPSSRRGEEAEAVAQALMRLGVLFQFQVYLYANDALRSESHVWTEALRSLMGSGSSSTVCMQVFLELVLAHPTWLQTFLMEAPYGHQNSARTWASDMLVWTMQAATKRCAHALQAYVSACVRDYVILGQEGPAMGQAVPLAQAQQLERALRVQLLPPLGQALIGVVEQLVLLIRGCLPRYSSSGQQISGLELPTEPALVLLAYLKDNPWGAAHLLQVFNIVPDLVDHLTAALQELNINEYDEMSPLIDLTHELVRYSSNLQQLTIQQQSGQQQQPPPNPYLRRLPGSSSSPSSSGSGGAGGGAGGGGVHAILPASTYAKLVQENFIKLLLQPFVLLECERAPHLASMLSWGNRDVLVNLPDNIAFGVNILKGRYPGTENTALSEPDWVCICRRLNTAVLQPDQFLQERVNAWLMGRFERPQPGAVPEKHQALLSYETAISWACVGAFRALNAACNEFFDIRRPRPYALKVLEAIAIVLALNSVKIQGDFVALLEVGSKQGGIMGVLIPFQPQLSQLLVFGANKVFGPDQTIVTLHPALQLQLPIQQQQQQMDEGDDGLDEGPEEGEAGDDDELLPA